MILLICLEITKFLKLYIWCRNKDNYHKDLI